MPKDKLTIGLVIFGVVCLLWALSSGNRSPKGPQYYPQEMTCRTFETGITRCNW